MIKVDIVCTHEDKKRLTEPGEYGSTLLTDWEYCPECGGIKQTHDSEWKMPALIRLLQDW